MFPTQLNACKLSLVGLIRGAAPVDSGRPPSARARQMILTTLKMSPSDRALFRLVCELSWTADFKATDLNFLKSYQRIVSSHPVNLCVACSNIDHLNASEVQSLNNLYNN